MLALIQQFPNEKVPTEIDETCKTGYNFVTVLLTQGTGFTQKANFRVVTYTEAFWNSISEENKKASYFGNFNSMIMLHDPTKIEVKKPVAKTKKKVIK
tara:strand:+ start:378 stop:671 length:294 start_codon:yes stop_codon:yes gene_type:complete